MSDFLLNTPRKWLLQALRSESADEGFSDEGVRISLYLDVDRGRIKSQRDYARIWGWTRRKVRYHWEDIWKDVARLCSSNGRQLQSPLVEGLKPAWREWLEREYGNVPPTSHPASQERPTQRPENEPSNAKSGDSRPTQRPTYVPPLAHPTSHHTDYIPTSLYPNPKERGSDAPAREDWEIFGPYPPPFAEVKAQSDSINLSSAMRWWNDVAERYDLAGVEARNDKRRAGIRQRFWEVWTRRHRIENEIAASRFLRGETKSSSWRVDFDFIFCTQDGFTKILEGKYRDQRSGKHSAPTGTNGPTAAEDPAAAFQRKRSASRAALGLES